MFTWFFACGFHNVVNYFVWVDVSSIRITKVNFKVSGEPGEAASSTMFVGLVALVSSERGEISACSVSWIGRFWRQSLETSDSKSHHW